MTGEQIATILSPLVALRYAPSDLAGHQRALVDMDADDLAAAVEHALRTRVAFPAPAELRTDADLMRSRRLVVEQPEDRGIALPEPVLLGHLPNGTPVNASAVYRYFCEACSDMGWISLWCGAFAPHHKPWQALGHCGRFGVHGNHEYVVHCACFDSNPKLVRDRERQRKYAADAAKASR